MDLSNPKEKNNINDQAMNEANELKKNFYKVKICYKKIY